MVCFSLRYNRSTTVVGLMREDHVCCCCPTLTRSDLPFFCVHYCCVHHFYRITEFLSRISYGNRGILNMTFSVVDHFFPKKKKKTPDFFQTKFIRVGAGSRLGLGFGFYNYCLKNCILGIFRSIPSRNWNHTWATPNSLISILYSR